MTTPFPFTGAPRREQVYLVVAGAVALALPLLLTGPWAEARLVDMTPPDWFSCLVLIAMSALNVEIGRVLVGGLSVGQQPHKALSAWAFACAMMLPAAWLLVVVPVTYAHARWRGLRVPLWKWMGSAGFLVLAGCAASLVPRWVLGGLPNWMADDGGEGLATLVLAALVFLMVEHVLFAGSAWLNHAEDEQWLRAQLTSPGYHVGEAGVVLTGGLMAAVWTAGPWFVLLFGPLYALMQRAVLVEPLRENAAMAAALVETNRQLEAVSEFKSDLMGMLAHEVGNPLASVTGYAEIATDALEEGAVDEARAAVSVVQRNADQIGGVLRDIVSLVEANPGGLTAHPEPTAVLPHLRAAAAAQPTGAQPDVHCPDDLVALIQPGHLDQVLANLLGNATKYAGGATRVVATRAVATLEGAHPVVIAVQDDGPGIPEDFRDQVFRRRTRHPDTADSVSGRGLGLHISRALALANGGDLRLSDSPAGTCFELVLQAPGD